MMRRSLVPDVPATLAQCASVCVCARVYCSRAAHVLPSSPALCCLINYVNITFRETLLTTPKNVAPSPSLPWPGRCLLFRRAFMEINLQLKLKPNPNPNLNVFVNPHSHPHPHSHSHPSMSMSMPQLIN